ncbi:MAG: putative flavoprotein involved in transport [Thermoleophilaceae bacterium]|nr:putative flavoprotein involved in transport [Thermoleophilaceae bacterium]
MEQTDVVVIGAGPAGLAAAGALRHHGIGATVLERSDAVGASWRGHYERLHLHTVRWLSHLPGYKLPRRYGNWVSRDDLVEYMEDYVAAHNLDVRTGVEVERLERDGEGWVVHTNNGGFAAGRVIIGTGYNKHPFLPDWPGLESYTGDLLHSAYYKNPEPYVGKNVLVVGTGNSGAEICVDLIEGGAAHVQMSVRTPPTVLLRDSNGLPGQALGLVFRQLPVPVMDKLWPVIQKAAVGDLSKHGLPNPPPGAYSKFMRDDVTPILDVGLVPMLKKGKVEVVPAVDSFEGADVVLADGSRIQPDAVIAGTGFKRGLEPLVGDFGLIEPQKGRPIVHGAKTHPNAPGLHFIGYTNPVSGMLREIAIDARRIAKAIASARA